MLVGRLKLKEQTLLTMCPALSLQQSDSPDSFFSCAKLKSRSSHLWIFSKIVPSGVLVKIMLFSASILKVLLFSKTVSLTKMWMKPMVQSNPAPFPIPVASGFTLSPPSLQLLTWLLVQQKNPAISELSSRTIFSLMAGKQSGCIRMEQRRELL